LILAEEASPKTVRLVYLERFIKITKKWSEILEGKADLDELRVMRTSISEAGRVVREKKSVEKKKPAEKKVVEKKKKKSGKGEKTSGKRGKSGGRKSKSRSK